MPPPNPSAVASELSVLPVELGRALEPYVDRLDVGAITRAYRLAYEAHAGQRRASGEEYVTHTVEVATILAGLRLDTASIVAGLVHDTVEDTHVTLGDLAERFGEEVASLVDGVTKIGKVEFRSHTHQQVENYRKLLLSMAADARVILIKLADRLHNMRTLQHLHESKQRRIALETREIYAPLAHRLGIFSIKWELEDLAFKYLEPESYEELTRKIAERRKEREQQIRAMKIPLEEELARAGIPVRVTGDHLRHDHCLLPLRDGILLSGSVLLWVPLDPVRPAWRFDAGHGFGYPRLFGDRLVVANRRGGVYVFDVNAITAGKE